MGIKKIVFSDYKDSSGFWNTIKVLASFKDEMEIVLDDETFENIPAEVIYLIREANEKDSLVIEGGCCLIDSMEYNIHYKEFKRMKSKAFKKIEVEAINKLFEKGYLATLYLNDDAKASIRLCAEE